MSKHCKRRPDEQVTLLAALRAARRLIVGASANVESRIGEFCALIGSLCSEIGLGKSSLSAHINIKQIDRFDINLSYSLFVYQLGRH